MSNSISLNKKDFKRILKQKLYYDWVEILILGTEEDQELYEILYLKNIGDFLTPNNIRINPEEAEENYYELLKVRSKSNTLYKDYLEIIEFYKDKKYKRKDIKNIVISIKLYDFLNKSELF